VRAIRFLALAAQEVDDAVRRYEENEPGLGRIFLDDIDRALRLIKVYPHAGTQIEFEIRRSLFTRFPYSLIYATDNDSIVVIAVAHQRREPLYWADRME
jgi:plasmid stabilization system protein ParE